MQSPLTFSFNDSFIEIELPAAHPDNLITVLVLEFNKKPEIEPGLIAKTVDGGYSLKPEKADSASGNNQFFSVKKSSI